MTEPDRGALLVASADQHEVAAALKEHHLGRGARLESESYEALRASPDEPTRWTGRLALGVSAPAARWVTVVDSTAGYADHNLAQELARVLGRPVRHAIAWPGHPRQDRDFGRRARFPRSTAPPLPAWEEQPRPEARFFVFSNVQHYSTGYQRSAAPDGLVSALEKRDVETVVNQLGRTRGLSRNTSVQLVFSAERLDLTRPDDARVLIGVHQAFGTEIELSSFQTLRLVQAAARVLEGLVLRDAVKRLGAERDRYVPMLRQLARTWRTQGLEEQSVLLEEAAMVLPGR